MHKESWLYLIILFIVSSSLLIPYVRGEFESSYSDTTEAINRIDDNVTAIETTVQDSGSSNFWKILKTISSIFFWSFGNIPFWIDLLLYLPLRLIAWYIIADSIWIG